MDDTQYVISPAKMPELQAAISASFPGITAPVIHTVGVDDQGNFLVNVVGFGINEMIVVGLCKLAQSHKKVVAPPASLVSEPMGTVTSRLEFTGLLYHIGASAHDEFGMQYYHRFITDDSNNEILWVTGRPAGLTNHKYKVSCRVKGHNRWSDIWQTLVTHCKLEAIQ